MAGRGAAGGLFCGVGGIVRVLDLLLLRREGVGGIVVEGIQVREMSCRGLEISILLLRGVTAP